ATLTASQLETLLETGGEAVGLLMSNLQRAAELISGFKLIAVDQTSFDRREIQLKSYLDDVVRSVAPALRHLKLTIEVDCDPCLILDTFPGAWSQIVTNLLMNTAIHGFDEGESGRVRIQVSGESTDLQILYTDSGKGVPEDVRAKIFNPFFTTRRGQGGSGLGMHIVSNLIHNAFFGSISCLDSESGASFLIRLPNGGCLPLQGGDL
ncbi:MAG: sensor histidine kinase, partial [Spongiibacteraceae bacterium]